MERLASSPGLPSRGIFNKILKLAKFGVQKCTLYGGISDPLNKGHILILNEGHLSKMHKINASMYSEVPL